MRVDAKDTTLWHYSVETWPLSVYLSRRPLKNATPGRDKLVVVDGGHRDKLLTHYERLCQS